MGYSCFPATSASKHSCSKSAEPQPHLISYPTKKCSLVCASSSPPCIFSKSSTHTKGWKAALLYSHSSTCLCSLGQRCISDINLLNISSLQAAESSGGWHAAEDQEGWCTKELIHLLPASSSQHPRMEPAVQPLSEVALLSSCPCSSSLWGLAPRGHSLSSVNPSNPPPQHTQGCDQVTVQSLTAAPCPARLLHGTRSCCVPPPDLSVLAFEAASASFKQATSWQAAWSRAAKDCAW